MTGRGFSLDLAQFAKATELKLSVVRRKAALDLLGSIIKRTPVKTGRARGAWIASVGSPAEGEGPADKAGDSTLSAAAQALQAAEADRPIYLTNNVPYIERLENGWSQQAPRGMVALAIKEFKQIIDKAVKEAGGG